jgi:hypothetical protein
MELAKLNRQAVTVCLFGLTQSRSEGEETMKKKKLTSFGWEWFQNGVRVAVQVGHEWNGEVLTYADKRILRRLRRLCK